MLIMDAPADDVPDGDGPAGQFHHSLEESCRFE